MELKVNQISEEICFALQIVGAESGDKSHPCLDERAKLDISNYYPMFAGDALRKDRIKILIEGFFQCDVAIIFNGVCIFTMQYRLE